MGLKKIEHGLLRSLEQRPATGGAGESAANDSRDWPGDGAQLGAGGGRGEAVLIGESRSLAIVACAQTRRVRRAWPNEGLYRNNATKHLQTVLVEAAKRAPRWSPELARVYENALQERQSESRHAGGGAQVSGVFAGSGP